MSKFDDCKACVNKLNPDICDDCGYGEFFEDKGRDEIYMDDVVASENNIDESLAEELGIYTESCESDYE